MRVFIVWAKKLVKHFFLLPNREFRRYLARWPFSRSTNEFDSLAWLLASSHVLHTWPFAGYSSHELVANYTESSSKLYFSPISHTHPLQLNPHKYREMIEKITIKFYTELSQQRPVGNHNFIDSNCKVVIYNYFVLALIPCQIWL